jgi:hypothetical protein
MIPIPSNFRHPADRYAINWHPSYREKAVWKLRKLAAWVAEVTFGCAHRHVTRPFNDRQTCLDCGASRLYIYNTEMYFAGFTDTPIFKGRWKKGGPHRCHHPFGLRRASARNGGALMAKASINVKIDIGEVARRVLLSHTQQCLADLDEIASAVFKARCNLDRFRNECGLLDEVELVSSSPEKAVQG